TESHSRPVLEVELERAATLFISQYIDDLEMFAPVRYELQKGCQAIFLKPMRVIHPHTGEYRLSVKVMASSTDSKQVEAEEICVLRKV
ncbi:MAG: hypothetical protein J6Q65_06340, partial [Lentisphaeria bacterium]|nr:hypothetical protein [Lentisphaeria bacterium]